MSNPRQGLLDYLYQKPDRPLCAPLAGGNWAASVQGREWIPDCLSPQALEDLLFAAEQGGFAPLLGTGWWEHAFVPWPMERAEVDENSYRTRQRIDTPHGPVEQVMCHAKKLGPRMETPAFTKIDERLFDLLEMIAARRDEPLASIRRAIAMVGDRGLLYMGTSCPHVLFGFINGENIIYQWHEDYGLFRAACERAFAATMNVIDVALEAGMESIFMATYGLSLFSPAILEDLAMPYLQKISQYLHARGKLLYVHECGKMREGIKRGWWNAVRPDVLEGFEAPPVGDIDDLAWSRQQLDRRIITKGNISIAALLNESPAAIARQARQVLAAVAGYPHLLGGACSLLYGTPVENVRAMAACING